MVLAESVMFHQWMKKNIVDLPVLCSPCWTNLRMTSRFWIKACWVCVNCQTVEPWFCNNERVIAFVELKMFSQFSSVTAVWNETCSSNTSPLFVFLSVVPRGWTVWSDAKRLWVEGAGVFSSYLLPGKTVDSTWCVGALFLKKDFFPPLFFVRDDFHLTVDLVRYLAPSSLWADLAQIQTLLEHQTYCFKDPSYVGIWNGIEAVDESQEAWVIVKNVW